jgi:hypothetical protein
MTSLRPAEAARAGEMCPPPDPMDGAGTRNDYLFPGPVGTSMGGANFAAFPVSFLGAGFPKG